MSSFAKGADMLDTLGSIFRAIREAVGKGPNDDITGKDILDATLADAEIASSITNLPAGDKTMLLTEANCPTDVKGAQELMSALKNEMKSESLYTLRTAEQITPPSSSGGTPGSSGATNVAQNVAQGGNSVNEVNVVVENHVDNNAILKAISDINNQNIVNNHITVEGDLLDGGTKHVGDEIDGGKGNVDVNIDNNNNNNNADDANNNNNNNSGGANNNNNNHNNNSG
ncbi:MAG: hypothetical protein ACI8Y4_003090, partial [Candidatus Poriferisodalaceae bacterium]